MSLLPVLIVVINIFIVIVVIVSAALTAFLQIYVGKLPETGCEEEDIKNHFAQFGAIAEVGSRSIFNTTWYY